MSIVDSLTARPMKVKKNVAGSFLGHIGAYPEKVDFCKNCEVVQKLVIDSGASETAGAELSTEEGITQKTVLAIDDNHEAIDIIRDGWSGELNPTLTPKQREHRNWTHSVGLILACKPYHWIDEFPRSIKPSPELVRKTREKWAKLFR